MLTGHERRRVQLDEINATAEERRLARELDGLREHVARARRMMNRHERAVRLPWLHQRTQYLANDLAHVRARLSRLRATLAE